MATLSYPQHTHTTGPSILFTAHVFKPSDPKNGSVAGTIQVKYGKKSPDQVVLYAPKDLKFGFTNIFSPTTTPTIGKEFANLGHKIINDLTAGAGAFIKAGYGYADTPTSVNVYKSTDNIKMSYSFDMVPQNETEAQNISSIVNFFRINGLPPDPNAKKNQKEGKVEIGKKGIKTLFIKYPKIFNIHLIVPGMSSTNQIMTQTYMGLTDMDVTYGEGDESYFVFKDGQPVKTKLTLNFQCVLPYVDNRNNYPKGGEGNSSNQTPTTTIKSSSLPNTSLLDTLKATTNPDYTSSEFSNNIFRNGQPIT